MSSRASAIWSDCMSGDGAATRELLFAQASIEVLARDRSAPAMLREHLPRGTRVHVTFLTNAGHRETVAQAAALTLAGFEPIPHLAARSIVNETMLNDFLSRAVGEAGVKRVLLIAGDLQQPLGPYASSLDILAAGSLTKHGLQGVAFAGHPEGHPQAPRDVMEQALREKLASAAAQGLAPEIVTQFAFEASPIVSYIARLRELGVAAPVRIGAAAPTSTARLLGFAARCGVGASVRALVRQGGRTAGLIAGPERMFADLADALALRDLGPISGAHFFVFGGAGKAAAWLRAEQEAAAPIES